MPITTDKVIKAPSNLELMFKKQYELYDRLLKDKLNVNLEVIPQMDPIPYLKDNIFFAIEELHEMCRELPFMKFWKDYTRSDWSAKDCITPAKEELIDVIHFLIDIGILLCIQPKMYTIPKFTAVLAKMEDRCASIKDSAFEIEKLLMGLFNIKCSDMQTKENSIKLMHDVAYLIVNEVISIACCLQMTNEECFDMYMKKNKVNHDRQDGGY